MEKTDSGFYYVTGNWRYSMISDEGRPFGRTNGTRSERVKFFIACHLAQEVQDHLFFVPEALRLTP